MLCCRRGSKEDENTTLVALSSGGGRGGASGGDSVHAKNAAKNGQQKQQLQQPGSTADGRRSSGDGDSVDHFPPYGSSGVNVHFNDGFQQRQQQQQQHREDVPMEDASTWRRQTTSTFFGDNKDSSSSSSHIVDVHSASLRLAHQTRPPSAFDVDVIEVRTSNDGGAATIPTSSGFNAIVGFVEEEAGAIDERDDEHEGNDVNVVVAPPPRLPPPTTGSEEEEIREEGEMRIRLLNDSSVSDASSFREDCPDLDVDVVDPLRPVRTVEIVKNPGESLGFYIREGDGVGQENGVFISRMTPESPLERSRLLNVGDEILTVNSINVSKMNLDDVVVIMSIPKRLVLLVRSRSRSAITDLPSYYLHQQHHHQQHQPHLHHHHRDGGGGGGIGIGGGIVPSSTSFLSQQQQQQLRRRESQYRSHPTAAVPLHHRLPLHPSAGGASSLPRGLPGNIASEVAAASSTSSSSNSRYSAHILSSAFSEKNHPPPPLPPHHHHHPSSEETLDQLEQDYPCDINAMKMSTLERKGKIERGNHLLKEHLKWDPCFEKDEALGQSIGSPSPSAVSAAMVPVPLVFDRIRQSSFRSSSSAAMTPPLKSSTSHLQHLQHLQQMQHHLQQPLYVGATHAEFGSTPQEDSNDSGHVSEVSGGGVCDPLGDAAHSSVSAGAGDVVAPLIGGSVVDAVWKRDYGGGGGGSVVTFESDVLGGRPSSARDDLTSLLYGTSGRVGGMRQGGGVAAAQSPDVPLRRLSHTSSMSRVTAASYASRIGQDDDSLFSSSLLSAQSPFARNPLTPPPSSANRNHPQSKYVNIHVNRLFGGLPPIPSRDDLFNPSAVVSFPSGVSSTLKRHGSETEVNRAGADLDRLPLFHSQQRRASPQRRFHAAVASTSATPLPVTSISKSVTIASASNHLQNRPTISAAHRDHRGHGSLGRGGAGGEDA